MGDEQARLLQEALQWAMLALNSARAQHAKLTEPAQDGSSPEEDEIQAARHRMDMAQQTVDEIRTRLASREAALQR